MIGIVVVSHSRALAEAAVGLASEMVEAPDLPRIAIAAGLDEATFGTDAAAVAEAVEEVDSPDGVLVLVDLGSAVMSAEMALELVDPQLAERVVISSAPLVEGLVAAVVLGSAGADLAAVVVEAQDGLAAKQSHLQGTQSTRGSGADGCAAAPSQACSADSREVAADQGPAEAPPEAAAHSVEIQIGISHGLHARPAAKLVSLVRRFDASVTLAHATDVGRETSCDAASLSQVATLNARQGDRLLVRAVGPDAEKALNALAQLASRDFDELAPSSRNPGEPSSPTAETARRGAATGSGLDIALGPAVVVDVQIDTSDYQPGDAALEATRSTVAVNALEKSLTALREDTARQVGVAEAEIFDAHLALASDPDLLDLVATDIAAGRSALEAWRHRLAQVAARFEALEDAYQRERAQDVREVEKRLLLELLVASCGALGSPGGTVEGGSSEGAAPGPGILVIPALDAATAATLDGERVLGIVTRQGGATGHGVIVAKSRGIPVCTDAGERLDSVTAGALIGFDARTGEVWVDPDEEDAARIRAEIESRAQHREQALMTAREPAVTRDGCHITVSANVTSLGDAAAALANGADGSGLVRAEVLFGAMTSAPSVQEQTEQFLSIAAAMGGRSITIRTWDVGGDKPLRFLPQAQELNPFLGERGLRLFRRQPDVLVDQLQAICRAARETQVKVMFPMVSSAEEVAWALDHLVEAAAKDSGGMPAGIQVGVMIEVPSAALTVRRVAADLDFVSIGTNDLTQYTMAAERGNAAVSHLAKALDPAVLRLLKLVCDEAPPAVEVAVCGDLASSPSSAVLLAGLGVRELSVVAPAVPDVKSALRRISLSEAELVGRRALQASTADEVVDLLESAQRTPQE